MPAHGLPLHLDDVLAGHPYYGVTPIGGTDHFAVAAVPVRRWPSDREATPGMIRGATVRVCEERPRPAQRPVPFDECHGCAEHQRHQEDDRRVEALTE